MRDENAKTNARTNRDGDGGDGGDPASGAGPMPGAGAGAGTGAGLDHGPGGVRVEVVRGVDALPEGLWQRLAPPDDPMWAREVFAAMEKGRIGPEGYAYVLLWRGEHAVAVLPLSLFRGLRLDDVVGPRERRALAPVRRWAPRALRVPMLFCGNLLGQGHLLFDGSPTRDEARLLVGAVKDFARRERFGTVVFKDFGPDALPTLWEALGEAGFFTVPSLPDTELSLGHASFDAYVAALPAKPRRNARSKLRKIAAMPGLRTRVVADWAPLVPAMLALYGQVMARADQTLDVLDADFLASLAPPAGGPEVPTDGRGTGGAQDSRVVACFQDDRLVAFLLCLFAGDGAVGARIGLDYELAHDARLYHAAHYAAIRLALERGCRHIRFAQTAYVPKLELGCTLVEQTYALTHLGPLRRGLLRRLLPPALARARADALRGAHEVTGTPSAARTTARAAPGAFAAPWSPPAPRSSPASRASRDPRASRPGREDRNVACPE
ncbi:GNAT family N-acetyltransferase [Streptomyces sp. NBC_01497]|uniref:GNAT family N-acetyltransferase n=1 Tax=Streptomyces sp. NBC_01497 TaxID=2903885 RepID=UPI002E37727C|nr:GNAT family N-acetyltransferase [Streptomyces sp. NBC_01497]